jgi:hypothetical protein
MNKEMLEVFSSAELAVRVFVILGIIWVLPLIILFFLSHYFIVRPIKFVLKKFKK